MKTPNARGGPVGQGAPESARRMLADLSVPGKAQPTGTAAQIDRVRAAMSQWQVQSVVIDGPSPDPVYTSGFFTMALGFAPQYTDGAYVWSLPHGALASPPALGASLYLCKLHSVTPSVAGDPLYMSQCVLDAAANAKAHA
jgi:hypothetical protein